MHCNSMGNYGSNQLGHPVMAKNISATGGTRAGHVLPRDLLCEFRGPTRTAGEAQLVSPAEKHRVGPEFEPERLHRHVRHVDGDAEHTAATALNPQLLPARLLPDRRHAHRDTDGDLRRLTGGRIVAPTTT